MIANPFFLDDDIVLLLHCNGTNGSTTFIDSSSYIHTVDTINGAIISTAQSVFGGSSLYCPSLVDGLFTPASSIPVLLDLFNENSTVDLRIRPASLPSSEFEYYPLVTMNNGIWFFAILFFDGVLWLEIQFGSGGTNGLLRATTTFSIDTWYHIAVERYNGEFFFYKDGTRLSTYIQTAWSAQNPSSASINVGSAGIAPGYAGYIDELRISRTARYEGNNFTPETAEYA